MIKIASCCASLIVASLVFSVPGYSQTWTIDAGNSNVQLDADTLADDFTVPGIATDIQSDSTFQTPFVDLLGDSFDIGENVSSSSTDGAVRSSAASVVKGNGGSSFSIEWRAATDLEMSGDIDYTGEGNAMLASDVSAELSGLIPGRQYKITYSYLVSSIAVEDHEGPLEDPESAASVLDFTFGSATPEVFMTNAGASAGFLDSETLSGSGMYMLTATAQPITLSVNMFAEAHAMFNNPFINGTPPEDGAGSEGFGNLTFRAELKPIPEPATSCLLAGLLVTALATRRVNRTI